jgi:NMD protein affecting ribosome stability and mRNA decay
MQRGSYQRNDRLIKEKRHDAYKEREKWPEPTLCTECGALFVNGRWTWKKATRKVMMALCPACQRSADNYPAGFIKMKGEFFQEHFQEIFNLIYNIEEQEKGEHPLERIMAVSDAEDHTLVTTTGVHIARRIGEALSRSYKGEYTFQYAEAENRLRVSWQR